MAYRLVARKHRWRTHGPGFAPSKSFGGVQLLGYHAYVFDDHPWPQVCRSRPALAPPPTAHIPDPCGFINLQTLSSFENAALTYVLYQPHSAFSISHLHPTHTPSPNHPHPISKPKDHTELILGVPCHTLLARSGLTTTSSLLSAFSPCSPPPPSLPTSALSGRLRASVPGAAAAPRHAPSPDLPPNPATAAIELYPPPPHDARPLTTLLAAHQTLSTAPPLPHSHLTRPRPPIIHSYPLTPFSTHKASI